MAKRNIRYSVGFDGKELQGYFMISNKDAATAILNRLTGSQLRLWLYLMMVDSFADQANDGEKIYHTIPSPQEIATKIGASPETVEKDMRKLKKLGLYEYRITAWQGHNLSAAKAREESERLKNKKTTTTSTAKIKTLQAVGLNKPQESLNNPSESLNKPQKSLNNLSESLNKPPEIAESIENTEVLASPQTIQTYLDFKKTLSEDERERFFYFVKQEVKNFREPIKDLEAWLASKNAAGQNRWEVYYKMYQPSLLSKVQNEDSPCLKNSNGSKTPKRLSLREEIELQRQEALAYYTSLNESEQQQEKLAENEFLEKNDSKSEENPDV
ncbi:hypothetical protein C7H19_22315 [Aphanothece hegewaldii CCALA 016]|uniref:Uncharacterized protein n=1 Tax=Aphanothece hegewaldii CCALA 016 TaxID=2107694 RepID=A0A2T1LRW9_9CHRO|nr:hypothetical protein [Aphanothece hegewaldii]PSF31762.1 hypothetical protein C7H19_22315 [Aphanothece hegewaldii CCALA 016]